MSEAEGFVFPDLDKSKPYLGDHKAVTTLVNYFADQVLEAESGFRMGKPEFKNAQARIQKLCDTYGDMIMGENPDVESAPWQNRDRLGFVIRRTIPGIKFGDDYGRKYFEYLALALINYNRRMERGEAAESIGQQIRVDLNDAIKLILGLKQVPE